MNLNELGLNTDLLTAHVTVLSSNIPAGTRISNLSSNSNHVFTAWKGGAVRSELTIVDNNPLIKIETLDKDGNAISNGIATVLGDKLLT